MKIFTIIKEKSERIPGKNFREIMPGVPLWKYMLGKFSEHDIFVDTDSPSLIAAMQTDRDFKSLTSYQRLKEHEIAYNPTNEMFDRFLEEYLDDDEEPVVYTHITSPFIQADMVEAAYGKFQREYPMFDSAVACIKEKNFAFMAVNGKYLPLNFNPQEIVRSQDLPPIVFLAHGFFITTKAMFKKYGSRFGPNPLMCELTHPENFDLDVEEDWTEAMAIARRIADEAV